MIERVSSLLILTLITSLAQAGNIEFKAEITDSRSSEQSISRLDIELRGNDESLKSCRGIPSFHVTKAMDDAGSDLLKPKDAQSTASRIMTFEKIYGDSGELIKRFDLKSPLRKAKAIKEISGTLELYFPDRDPKAKTIIKGFMTQTGKPLKNDALKKSKVTLTIFTKPQYDAWKEQQDKAKKKNKGPDEMISSALGELFGGFDYENGLGIMIQDPEARLVDIEILNAGGEDLMSGGRSAGGEMLNVNFDQLPGNDAQLVLYLKTKTSVVQMPFQLTNLLLP